jgi:hydroxypyruvate isomerase
MLPASWGPVDANISILFTELSMERRPAAARAAGFTAIEAWWPFASAAPTDTEVEAFERAVRDAGVELVSLNGFAGDMAGGDRGVLSWPGRELEFEDNLDLLLAIGVRLGCGRFNLLYGNRQDGADPATQDELALEHLTRAATAAQRASATIVVEPLSGAPAYPLRTADDVLAVIDQLPPNAMMLADLYHLCVNGEDVPAVLDRAQARIGHVQVADVPGRHEPGTGSADLDGWVRQLRDLGYNGSIGLEYAPLHSTTEGLAELASRGSAGGSPPGPQRGGSDT